MTGLNGGAPLVWGGVLQTAKIALPAASKRANHSAASHGWYP